MGSIKVEMTYNKCDQCEYTWLPRLTYPALCPACKSERWDKGKGKSKKAMVIINGKNVNHPTCDSCTNFKNVKGQPEFGRCIVFDTKLFKVKASETYCNSHSRMRTTAEE
jgi:hypothetical protein